MHAVLVMTKNLAQLACHRDRVRSIQKFGVGNSPETEPGYHPVSIQLAKIVVKLGFGSHVCFAIVFLLFSSILLLVTSFRR